MKVGGLIGRLFLMGLVTILCFGIGVTAASAGTMERAKLAARDERATQQFRRSPENQGG